MKGILNTLIQAVIKIMSNSKQICPYCGNCCLEKYGEDLICPFCEYYGEIGDENMTEKELKEEKERLRAIYSNGRKLQANCIHFNRK